MKRWLREVLGILVVLFVVGLADPASMQAEAAGYDPGAAVNYAIGHYTVNDSIKCAEFVYNCLTKGGGLDLGDKITQCHVLRNKLLSMGFTEQQYTYKSSTGGRIYNDGNIKAGDVVFWKKPGEATYPHVGIISGIDSKNSAEYIGHNFADRSVWLGSYPGDSRAYTYEVYILHYPTESQVTEPQAVKVQQIRLSYSGKTIARVNRTITNTEATVSPSNASNRSVVWESSNAAVATVTGTGDGGRTASIHTVGVGSAVITCRAADGSNVSASFEIEVHAGLDKTKLLEARNMVPENMDQNYTSDSVARVNQRLAEVNNWLSDSNDIDTNQGLADSSAQSLIHAVNALVPNHTHQWDSRTPDKAAGVIHYTCSTCGTTKDVTAPTVTIREIDYQFPTPTLGEHPFAEAQYGTITSHNVPDYVTITADIVYPDGTKTTDYDYKPSCFADAYYGPDSTENYCIPGENPYELSTKDVFEHGRYTFFSTYSLQSDAFFTSSTPVVTCNGVTLTDTYETGASEDSAGMYKIEISQDDPTWISLYLTKNYVVEGPHSWVLTDTNDCTGEAYYQCDKCGEYKTEKLEPVVNLQHADFSVPVPQAGSKPYPITTEEYDRTHPDYAVVSADVTKDGVTTHVDDFLPEFNAERGYSFHNASWYLLDDNGNAEKELGPDDTFEAGRTYEICTIYELRFHGSYVTDSLTITINNETPVDTHIKPIYDNPDDLCAVLLTASQTFTVPEEEHTWSEDWSYDDTAHWHACTDASCSITDSEDMKDYAEHTWDDGEVTKEATVDEPGEKTYTCTVCGAVKTETISKEDENKSDEDMEITKQSLSDDVLTDGMKDAGFTSVDKVTEALEAEVSELDGFDPEENTSVFDLSIRCRVTDSDGNITYRDYTEEELAGGVTVTIPYPDGTSGDGWDFAVFHMKHDGSIEQMKIDDEEKDGLRVTFTSLSPVLVSAKEEEDSEDDNESHPHVHEMRWEITTEPTEFSDGEKQYHCITCGYVEYTAPLSAFEVWNCKVADSIQNAKQGATVSVDATRMGWISFAPIVFQKLDKRPDVTLDLLYRYQGKKYEMVIPAGADLSKVGDFANESSDHCCGFLYLGQFFETEEQ